MSSASSKPKRARSQKKPPAAPPSDPSQIGQILDAIHPDPFSFLGLHPHPEGKGMIWRGFLPQAKEVSLALTGSKGKPVAAERIHEAGFFQALFPRKKEPTAYHLTTTDWHGSERTFDDPYRFGTIFGEQDIYFLSEGTHYRLYQKLGAHPSTIDGVAGVRFAVWAPNARRVSIIGDFNQWDGRVHPMRKLHQVGVWEIFLPGLGLGEHYKFEIIGAHGNLFAKSDPFAFFNQHGPQTASITYGLSDYQWQDDQWMEQRAHSSAHDRPMSVYEVHLGSWARGVEEGNRFLSYPELTERLLDYVEEMAYTHIELMPVSEFPFDGSWGYQVGNFFAPTSRFGNPDEFRALVDRAHQRGIGVILDWVPGHFPKDPHGLAQFDGTHLYEHADPRQGEHPDWGTLIFNYGRTEVRNFLIGNALYWLEQFHIDGLRVDAVASMLYLDYSREHGEWVPNRYGGRENLEAIEFLQHCNAVCYERFPGVLMIAEESTAWPGVTKPTDQEGLGFGFKWNMGWMHDFLHYMERDPIHRRYHHNEATFSMIYSFHENFILVLSHDEVVHGKGSLINKMPGDDWQKFANLRLFYAWMYGHPGKKLLFQGGEFAQWREWSHENSIDWHLLESPMHRGVQQLVRDLNALYKQSPALWELDHTEAGFEWIDGDDAQNSTFSFVRKSAQGEQLLFVINATPVVRENFRLGVPTAGLWRECLNTDSAHYGGSDVGNSGAVQSEATPHHGREHSVRLTLPPLATLAFRLEQ